MQKCIEGVEVFFRGKHSFHNYMMCFGIYFCLKQQSGKQKNTFHCRIYGNRLPLKITVYNNEHELHRMTASLFASCFSMRHVIWATWQLWRFWSQGEPCWTHLAMKMILHSMMLWGMDMQLLLSCCCSSVPHRTFCKLHICLFLLK